MKIPERLHRDVAESPDAGADIQRLRPGIFVALLCLLTVPWLLYAAYSIDTALEMRRRSALERNQVMAQIAAHRLDEQCNTAQRVLRHVAERPAQRSGDTAAARETVRDAVETAPDLLFAGIYRGDGSRIAYYVGNPLGHNGSLAPRRYKPAYAGPAPYITRIVRLKDRNKTLALSVAVPVPSRRLAAVARKPNYLLGFYRLRGIDDWARQAPGVPENSLYLLDSSNRVLTGSNRAGTPGFSSGIKALRLVRPRTPGGTVVRTPRDGRNYLVGYAYAGVPRWSILVVEPATASFAPTRALLLRLLALLAPVLILVGLSAREMARLYQRREEARGMLAKQNENLRAIASAKSDFLANVSHDLGTPLTNIQVAISGLLDPSVTWEKAHVHDCLTIASEEVEVLKTRVRNLLEMSRIDAKAYAFRKEPCELNDVASAVLERLEPLLHGRTLTVDFSGGPLLIEGDHGQMETVLRNLLENAIKYSPPGTPIHLHGTRRGGNALLFVRDQGPGIPKGDEGRIFMKFYRSHGTVSGTGLGLAICQAIVSEHRGMISARTLPEGGAEFCVLVPLLIPRTMECHATPEMVQCP